MSEPRKFMLLAAGSSAMALNPGSISTAMIENPIHGSTSSFFEALYATISGRNTNTHCHIRLTKSHDGGRSVVGSAQLPITSSVDISDMKVMNSEAPSRAPMIGRNESERNSKKLSSHASFPRGPWDRAAALTSASDGPSPPPPSIPGRACISL